MNDRRSGERIHLRLVEFDQPAGGAEPYLAGVGFDLVDLVGGQAVGYGKTADGGTADGGTVDGGRYQR